MLTFCEIVLDGQPTLGKDARDANSKISVGDGLPRALSTTWMHELLHIWTVLSGKGGET